MGTWSTPVSHLSWGLLAAITCTVLLLEGSASAQFAPSGGALLHGEQAAPPPPPVAVTEPPADTTDGTDAAEQEQVKHDIAGFDKANFNGFFVQSRDEQFRCRCSASRGKWKLRTLVVSYVYQQFPEVVAELST